MGSEREDRSLVFRVLFVVFTQKPRKIRVVTEKQRRDQKETARTNYV